MRRDPAPSGTDADLLTGFLDFLRETILLKAEGLDAAQLATALPPSSLTLGGLLNHLALVEDSWFPERFAGQPGHALWRDVDWTADPDFEFRTAKDVEPDELRRRYRDACDRSREVVAAADGLAQLSAWTDREGNRHDLRWTLIHMIEETARHAGHADLIRESIDGQVGE